MLFSFPDALLTARDCWISFYLGVVSMGWTSFCWRMLPTLKWTGVLCSAFHFLSVDLSNNGCHWRTHCTSVFLTVLEAGSGEVKVQQGTDLVWSKAYFLKFWLAPVSTWWSPLPQMYVRRWKVKWYQKAQWSQMLDFIEDFYFFNLAISLLGRIPFLMYSGEEWRMQDSPFTGLLRGQRSLHIWFFLYLSNYLTSQCFLNRS